MADMHSETPEGCTAPTPRWKSAAVAASYQPTGCFSVRGGCGRRKDTPGSQGWELSVVSPPLFSWKYEVLLWPWPELGEEVISVADASAKKFSHAVELALQLCLSKLFGSDYRTNSYYCRAVLCKHAKTFLVGPFGGPR